MRGASGIAVVIPCHNAEPWLAQTLDSVLAQSLPATEILVVDDGSTDGSRLVAEAYGDPVRVVSRRNGNSAATRNLGASLVGGLSLMFLDADDVLDPAALEALNDGLGRAPNGVVLGPWRRLELDASGGWAVRPASCAPRRYGQDALAAWLTGWFHPPCAVLWSRAGLDRAGDWDPAAYCNDDGELMMRALALGVPLAQVRGGGGFYRRLSNESGSLSGARYSRKGLSSRLYVIDKIAGLLVQQGRLHLYRTPLVEAIRRIEQDCGDKDEDLRQRCRARVARFGDHGRLPRLKAFAQLMSRRLVRFRPRPLELPPALPAPGFVHRVPASTGAPLVSVILPVRDRASVVGRAIASVLDQSVGDLELVVIDDGSRDALDAALRRFSDPRLRLLRHPFSRNAAAARNLGLRAARGRFLAFIDSDDCWLPGSLSARIAALEDAPAHTGLVFGRYEHVRADGSVAIAGTSAPIAAYQAMLERNLIVGTPGVMLSRRVLEIVGLFDEGMPACEDYDYWLRVSRYFGVAFVEQPLFRWNDEPSATSGGQRLSGNVAANLRARDRLFAKHGVAMRQAGTAHRFLFVSAKRRLRRRNTGGQRHLLAALRERPLALSLWAWLAYALLPWPVRAGLRRMRWRCWTPDAAGTSIDPDIS